MLNAAQANQRFTDLLNSLNSFMKKSNKNRQGTESSKYGIKSYGYGYMTTTVSASITYQEVIKVDNYGKLVPYFMELGKQIVSDSVKIPVKNAVIEPELLKTKELVDNIVARRESMNTDSVTCRRQCFGGCTSNCFSGCIGSCATSCSATCGENCNNKCQNTCTGSCVTTCATDCVSTCKDGCSGCTGGCRGTCTGGCGNNCYGGCGGGNR